MLAHEDRRTGRQVMEIATGTGDSRLRRLRETIRKVGPETRRSARRYRRWCSPGYRTDQAAAVDLHDDHRDAAAMKV
jgi:hypothetical protein